MEILQNILNWVVLQVWDTELAAVAQMRAKQCIFEHDCSDCRRVGKFNLENNSELEWSTVIGASE